MEKRSPYENTDFYSGYEESTEGYVSEREKVKMEPLKYESNMYATQKKKELILIGLMIIPTTICLAVILWSVGVISINPIINQILTNAFPFMSTLPAVVFSVIVVRSISIIDKNRKVLNKHVFHFMGFAVACGMFAMSSNPHGMQNILSGGWWRMIPFLTALGFLIWSFLLYTKFEKIIFIPIMAVTFLSLFLIF